MKEWIVARRYAKALVRLADKNVEAIESGLKELIAILIEKRGIFKWLIDEEVPHMKRIALLKDLSVAMGLHPTLFKFVKLLIEKERIALLPDIAKAFDLRADAIAGVARGRLVVASLAGQPNLSDLQAKFTKILGRRAAFTVHEDPELLGGFLVHIGNRIWDATLRRWLEDLKSEGESVH